MANLTFSYDYSDHNPNMDDASMDHYKCTLRNGPRSMTVYFSKGSGHNHAPPSLDEVMDCLALDCAGLGSFEDWCSEFGYDTDSRKAERTYKAIVKQETGLRRLLGNDFDAIVHAEVPA